MIPVMEIFGPTIQGEGIVIGRKTMFVRTAGCDFRCSWCDSKFTWDGTMKDEIRMMTAEEIYGELRAAGGQSFNHVTLSGGNPALIKDLGQLIDLLHLEGCQVALETQGSKYQDWMNRIDQLTISPKPPSSTMNQDLDKLDDIISQLDTDKINLKVVVFEETDYQFAKKIHHCYPQLPFYIQVGNPYLDDSVDNHTEKLLHRYEALIDRVMADDEMNNVYVTPQLHTLLWSNQKGV
ncbi:7-carboxy-7-deazaguanine synthase QueE [Macrococcus hajekii]|uniref:7-carboxy-7-deazaguanine synthase n=1 Tax=Macrococcus hajekii TaxID=198482 RepID=A0A4R6BIN9_9STAP|nr:7-carboxy-7-deazaguanine synthase QueE [Macrococcus hajekii]TDM01515.1 7-carboxy-7-deazaguanine synthase QueE [Macrococcus hajekii]GGB00610.1 7-carboxy-7-deazaguanine synthase [Macrococcus hajekii]